MQQPPRIFNLLHFFLCNRKLFCQLLANITSSKEAYHDHATHQTRQTPLERGSTGPREVPGPIVTIYPAGFIGLRLEGTRTEETIPIEASLRTRNQDAAGVREGRKEKESGRSPQRHRRVTPDELRKIGEAFLPDHSKDRWRREIVRITTALSERAVLGGARDSHQ